MSCVADMDVSGLGEIIDVDFNIDGNTTATFSPKYEKDNDEEEVIFVQETKKAKMVAPSTKTSSAQLDPCLPDYVKNSYHVLEMEDNIYDAMLTKANVEDNSNNFDITQILEAKDGSCYLVYHRWGRIGMKGEDKLLGPYLSSNGAILEFEQQFYEKTKNHWSNRKNFESYPKCHTWLQMDYNKKGHEKLFVSRNLHPSVEKFIAFIFDIKMMTQQMTDMGYNAERLPLMNLSKSTIMKGYDVLKLISEVIGESNRQLLEELSGEFYEIIPHDFGTKKLCEFIIDTPQKLIDKMEMVESLAEIERASTLLSFHRGLQEDVLYEQYRRLHCKLVPVEAESEEFSMIEKYMNNDSNKSTSASIVQIFRVSREGEKERFKMYADTKNRMLLWHGSRLTNCVGILSEGLRIFEQARTGSRFGRGIYFADVFSKSVTYCYPGSSEVGILLLCEVALGEMEELACSEHTVRTKKLSVKGVGTSAPAESQVLEDGVVVPLGKTVKTKGNPTYNEYVVYNVDQIRMRYIVQVKFRSTSDNDNKSSSSR